MRCRAGCDGTITDYALYALGLRDSADGQDDPAVRPEPERRCPHRLQDLSVQRFIGIQFKLVNAADRYLRDDDHNAWVDKSDDKDFMKSLVASGETLTVVGVVQPKEDASASMLSSGIAYPAASPSTSSPPQPTLRWSKTSWPPLPSM